MLGTREREAMTQADFMAWLDDLAAHKLPFEVDVIQENSKTRVRCNASPVTPDIGTQAVSAVAQRIGPAIGADVWFKPTGGKESWRFVAFDTEAAQ